MKLIFTFLIALVSNQALAEADTFSGVADSKPACYGREYGIDHLKSKPLQTVQKIQAKLEHIDKYNQNILSLEVTLKGEKNKFTNYRAFFTCDQAGNCTIDCDGGRVSLSMVEGGKLKIDNQNFVLAGGCSESQKEVMLKAAAGGDDSFALEKLPEEMCQTVTDYNK